MFICSEWKILVYSRIEPALFIGAQILIPRGINIRANTSFSEGAWGNAFGGPKAVPPKNLEFFLNSCSLMLKAIKRYDIVFNIDYNTGGTGHVGSVEGDVCIWKVEESGVFGEDHWI
ncbi:MAG: hypothetical protein A2007_05900 [Verrucomicrobia bacterium GWC2_42_7]|nr:MAG: hypothetical protein A2007_05900 [Verrucomicrobia bacterium GWC2_42_7]